MILTTIKSGSEKNHLPVVHSSCEVFLLLSSINLIDALLSELPAIKIAANGTNGQLQRDGYMTNITKCNKISAQLGCESHHITESRKNKLNKNVYVQQSLFQNYNQNDIITKVPKTHPNFERYYS